MQSPEAPAVEDLSAQIKFISNRKFESRIQIPQTSYCRIVGIQKIISFAIPAQSILAYIPHDEECLRYSQSTDDS